MYHGGESRFIPLLLEPCPVCPTEGIGMTGLITPEVDDAAAERPANRDPLVIGNLLFLKSGVKAWFV